MSNGIFKFVQINMKHLLYYQNRRSFRRMYVGFLFKTHNILEAWRQDIIS